MKDDLNKPEDKKQKQPKFEKKSTDQRTQATPPVDNSGEEEIPEWKSSIRREPVQEEKPERTCGESKYGRGYTGSYFFRQS